MENAHLQAGISKPQLDNLLKLVAHLTLKVPGL